MTSPLGHSRSYEFKWVFFPQNFDRIELECWGWCQCVFLAETHRRICNMTCVSHHVTSRDLDLRSDFDLGLLMSACTRFDVPRREKHDAAPIFLSFFFCWNVIQEKCLANKAPFTFSTSRTFRVEVRPILTPLQRRSGSAAMAWFFFAPAYL